MLAALTRRVRAAGNQEVEKMLECFSKSEDAQKASERLAKACGTIYYEEEALPVAPGTMPLFF